MNNKIVMLIGALAIVAAGIIVFAAYGGKFHPPMGETGKVPVSTEQKGKQALDTDSGSGGCVAGTSVTKAGITYIRTGLETYSVRGTELQLCCWETGVSQKRIICGDNFNSPVDYQYGLMWDMNKSTGNRVLTMERYLKDGKKCRTLYDPRENTSVENCD